MTSPSEPAPGPATKPSVAPDGGDRRLPHDRILLTLGFLLAGWLVVLYAAWVSPVFAIPANAQFGLLEVLPPTYWLGLGLVGVSVALAMRGSSDFLFGIVGANLLGLFAFTAPLFEPNAPIWDTYVHFTSAQAINTTGHLPLDPTLYATNWPGFYLATAFANVLGGLPPIQLVALFPLFSGIVTFLALFVFLDTFFDPQVARPASVLSAVLCVWAQFHVSPQGIGLALALLVLATAWERRLPLRAANALLFLGLVVSHATSAIFLLAFFGVDFVLAALARLRSKAPESAGTLHSGKYNPILTYAGVWLGWLFFVASGSADIAKTAVATQIGKILQIGETTAGIVAARSVENIYVWPPRLRLAALGLFGLVGLLALAFLLRGKGERARARFLIATLIGLGALGLADILFFGGFFYDRALMFFAVFVPGLCLYGFAKLHVRPIVKRAVIVVLLVGALAAASTTYYQEAFNFVPEQSVAVSEFLSAHGNRVLAVDGLFPQPIWRQNQGPGPWTDAGFFAIEPVPLSSVAGPSPSFAVFDPTARLWYIQGRGIEIYQQYEAQQAKYSLVYDNGFAQAYLLYSPPAGG